MSSGKLVRNITKNYVQIQCHGASKESLAFIVSSFDFESWKIYIHTAINRLSRNNDQRIFLMYSLILHL